jgi:hypothetical protein
MVGRLIGTNLPRYHHSCQIVDSPFESNTDCQLLEMARTGMESMKMENV